MTAGDFADGSAAGEIGDVVTGAAAEPELTWLRVRLNEDAAQFDAMQSVRIAAGSGGVADLIAADVDGDGQPDFVGTLPAANLVAIVQGDPATVFGQDTRTFSVPAEPGQVAAEDINKDGRIDLVVSAPDAVFSLLQNDDDGFEQPRTAVGSPGLRRMLLKDINGDELPDLILIMPNELRIHLGLGNGSFAANHRRITGTFVAAAISDFTGDQYLDLAIADAQGLRLFAGSPQGLRGAGMPTAMLAIEALAVADVDADAARCQEELLAIGRERLTVLFGEGDGSFAADAEWETVVPGVPDAFSVTDVLGLELPDFLVVHRDQAEISVGVNRATGTGDLVCRRRPLKPACGGDCDDNGSVTVNELIVGVNIALGSATIGSCGAFDGDWDEAVTIGELIVGVNRALDGCS